jgi:hypothetical protein
MLCFTYVAAQPVQTPPATVRVGAYGSLHGNAFSFITNQGALGNVRKTAAALYGERRFLLRELSQYQLAFVLPVQEGAVGLHLEYEGTSDLNTSVIGVAYGRSLGKKVGLGLQFNYYGQHLRGYGYAAQLTAALGLLVHVSDAVHVGLQASNAAAFVFGKAMVKQPAVYTLGVEYDASKNLVLTAECIKIQDLPVAVQTGMAYHFSSRLWAKAGINSGNAAFFIAAGFQLNGFSIEVSGSVHPQLGNSPGLLLLYNNMDK